MANLLYGNGHNPKINTASDELAELMDGFLSPEKLMQVSGEKDLDRVTSIVLKLDTRLTSVASVGKTLPNLEKFKLNNSCIPSIRDLGSGYQNLTVLWMARCSLTELDGIASLESLKELYLANNELCDISSIGMLELLQVLDLEGNLIQDIEQVEELALCAALVELTLEGNPVTGCSLGEVSESDEDDDVSEGGGLREVGEGEESNRGRRDRVRMDFRMVVWGILPKLRILDDEELAGVHSTTHGMLFFFSVRLEGLHGYSCSTAGVPLASSSQKAHPKRPMTSVGNHFNAKYGILDENEDFGSSELTFGTGDTMAGNPVLFLRSRRQRRSSESASTEQNVMIAKLFTELRNPSPGPPSLHHTKNTELASLTARFGFTSDGNVKLAPMPPATQIQGLGRGGRRAHVVKGGSTSCPAVLPSTVSVPVAPPTRPPPQTMFRRREYARTLKPLDGVQQSEQPIAIANK
ncbi:hypothetical protein BJ741DRAFT_307264 [Chytriomyces cf. hyalinus JEL632]|nr:hypothetical protein BJ741DRAFT_307264 [Chytriomyces cf. hyalinus JEL632]